MSLPTSFAGRIGLPVVAAPMFLVSNPALVIAACRAGVVGTFPALNQRTSAGFEEWLQEITAALAASGTVTPWGVNLIVHRSNPRLEADLEICIRHRVPLIITSLGAVSDLVDRVHAYGGVVFHDVISMRHARKAAAAGVDGLIAVCAGAGGHAGTLSPFALIQEIRSFFTGTVLLAGCITRGEHVAAALAMGADLAYLGTRFINTRESAAPDEYKQMIAAAAAEDIVYTDAVSGVNANFLRQSLEANGFDVAALLAGTGAGTKPGLESISDEARAWKTIWSAGQGVGGISDAPGVAEICTRLGEEFRTAAAGLAASAAALK
jgi:nitronate monooxygenase